ncbi:hypothetical protein CYLTODRAFT_417610, partial [Cylindrobasidium torrendii FP15055 ss-10]
MGFCRRCGDIVTGQRCKCGGTAVAPVVSWNNTGDKGSVSDAWSRTYVSRDPSPTRPTAPSATAITPTATGGTTSRRFPRPISKTPTGNSAPVELGQRVTAHITSTTSQINRTASTLKQSVVTPEAGILPSLYDKSLSKVYGSVLQTQESLATHACTGCADVFPPDATIYPSSEEGSFYCLPCFTKNGGSKGPCASCGKDVMTLKSAGGFVEVADQFWHKKCFNCNGCDKWIGDNPMVDLLGRPSCQACFDSCLRRDSTPKKKRSSVNIASLAGTPGSPSTPMTGGYQRERKESFHIQELEQRLGIVKSRPSSPTMDSPRPTVPAPRPSDSASRASITPMSLVSARATLSSPSRKSTSASTSSPSTPISFPSREPARVSSHESFSSPVRGSPRSPTRNSFSSPVRESISSPSRTSISSPSRNSISSPVRNSVSTSSRESLARNSISAASRYSISSPTSGSTKSQTPQDSNELTSPTSKGRYDRFKLSNRPDARRSMEFKSTPSSPVKEPAPSLPTPVPSPPSTPKKTDDKKLPHTAITSPSLYSKNSPISSPMSTSTPSLVSDISMDDASTMSSLNLDSPYLHGFDSPSQVQNSTRVFSFDSSSNSDDDRRSSPRPNLFSEPVKQPTPEARPPAASARSPPPASSSVVENASMNCAKCHRKLFSVASAGRYVTVPDEIGHMETYHQNCFKCHVCELPFKEGVQGQAMFVRGPKGPSHLECSPPQRSTRYSIDSPSPKLSPVRKPMSQLTPGGTITTTTTTTTTTMTSSNSGNYNPRTTPATATVKPRSNTLAAPPSPKASLSTPPSPRRESARYMRPTTPVVSSAAPRFGGSSYCPGCQKPVSVMERGVVPGPQGTRWHSGCLLCGGKPTNPGTPAYERARQGKRKGEAGCGKRLDSSAKTDEDNNVWCRDCLLLLATSRGPSPTRPVVPSNTGPQVPTQLSGTTTLARHFTGMGSNEGSLLRQMTGGASAAAPPRSLSPTKQMGVRPRPRSVIGGHGMSRPKSMDAGRGMFLVRQMTGGKSQD